MAMENILRDWARNRQSVKSLFVVTFYRASALVARHPCRVVRFLGAPVRILYKICVEFVMGIELPDRVEAGPGLAIFHGVGLVVNARAKLGSDVTLRQNTTIGIQREEDPAPRIEDGVSIGANAVVLGSVTIGAGTIIGAGAIVTKDCPEESVVYAARSTMKPRFEKNTTRRD